MSTRFQIGTLALALSLGLGLTSGTGCDSTAPAQDSGNRKQADGGWYGKMPNGTGIYIATTNPRSEWGIYTSYGWYYVTGFTNTAPTLTLNGGYASGGSFSSADGEVASADWAGDTYLVREIRSTGSELHVILTDFGMTKVFDLSGDMLKGLVVHVRIPMPIKRGDKLPYSLIFESLEKVDSSTGDLGGFQIVTLAENIVGAAKQPFCSRTDLGMNEAAVFSQGSQWNVMTASRTDNGAMVSVSCASGAIGRCEQWGYRPWEKATVASTGLGEMLVDAHQSCIYMKRADYCGTGDTYTEDGTMIGIDDNFTPAFQKSGTDKIEAIWGPKGAFCLSNRRHPDIAFPGCAVPLPTCSAASYGTQWYVQSGLM